MKGKVLLVDDSSTALLMGETVFKEHTPYEVVTARDGEEGVAKALADKPDLILLDVIMPKMDGFTACEEMRKHPLCSRGNVEHCGGVVIAGRISLAADRFLPHRRKPRAVCRGRIEACGASPVGFWYLAASVAQLGSARAKRSGGTSREGA